MLLNDLGSFFKNSLPIVRNLDRAVSLLIIQVFVYSYLQGEMNGKKKIYKASSFLHAKGVPFFYFLYLNKIKKFF
jgi:hypothetical protein